MPDQKPSAGHGTGKSMSADLRDELMKLMNYQRHGKPITKFQATHIAPDLMHYIQTSSIPIKDVIGELERSDDPTYKAVSDQAAFVMNKVWAGEVTQDDALSNLSAIMPEDIAQSLTAGKSSTDCLAALKRYFEVLHPTA